MNNNTSHAQQHSNPKATLGFVENTAVRWVSIVAAWILYIHSDWLFSMGAKLRIYTLLIAIIPAIFLVLKFIQTLANLFSEPQKWIGSITPGDWCRMGVICLLAIGYLTARYGNHIDPLATGEVFLVILVCHNSLFDLNLICRESRYSTVPFTVFWTVFVLGLGGTVFFAQSVKHERVYLTTQITDDVVYLPPALTLRMTSLGYGPFFGDMLFIRTHAYYLRHLSQDQIFRWLEDYVDAVGIVDPDNCEIFHWASMVVRYGQSVNEEVVNRSSRFAERGLECAPNDSRLYAQLGWNQYFELRPAYKAREEVLRKRLDATTDPKEREKIESKLGEQRSKRYDIERQALENYHRAAMLPHSPVDPIFLFYLYVKQGYVEAASKMAKSRILIATKKEQIQLFYSLERAGRKDLAEQLRKMAAEYAKEMPYIPPSLFRMLGSRHAQVVPRTWHTIPNALGTARLGSDTPALRKRP